MSINSKTLHNDNEISFEEFRKEIISDYNLAYESRQASLIGRKEVLTGKAKFGIFGDGKEVAQIAMAKAFKKGDIRSGYYRDQTFMFAAGISNVKEFFAQLYAHTDLAYEPASAGRLMNGHFGTRFLDEKGNWKNLTEEKHSTTDISPTAGQMARALGIAYASKIFRDNHAISNKYPEFSKNGNEVSFVTIGNASASEGHFWETVNAAGVLQVPLAISIWDDAYGISVPAKYQTTKENLGELLKGFENTDTHAGFSLYTCKGWDYPALCEMYLTAVEEIRNTHNPAIFHVTEITQPQGHSTSGSHERYKSQERLAWELEHDCIKKMREWMLKENIASEDELNVLEKEAIIRVNEWKREAYATFRAEINGYFSTALQLLEQLAEESSQANEIQTIFQQLKTSIDPIKKDVISALRRALWATKGEDSAARKAVINYKNELNGIFADQYNSHLNSESEYKIGNLEAIPASYSEQPEILNGYEILNKFFDYTLETNDLVFAIGEDVGKIGDVNQGFMNLQGKYGEIRVTDTGIRETTILGQGLGAAMRGLRPIIEIQYLDYLLYALQTMSDDLATLQYRTKGGQKSPLIIRTRGHRLEGIWHSGSPMGMIIHALRGINILVPRNMVQAVGYYNALLKSDEPGLIVECLNGYRLKEAIPENLNYYTLIPGEVEVLHEGSDITIVTYGSCCRIAQDACNILEQMGISVELIDVQSLIPFDNSHRIVASLKKTNRILFLDEDVPGGATSYLMQQVLEVQGGYFHLDSKPYTLTAKAHRPAYSSDGDYFSKPSVDDVVETVYAIMHEAEPGYYTSL